MGFVIFDNKAKELFISETDLEKPLYYYLNKKDFYFGSEIKFLKSLKKIQNQQKVSNICFRL